jgi:hypothetical protein
MSTHEHAALQDAKLDELLPCPFCGGEGIASPPTCRPSTPYNPRDRLYPIVFCKDCGVSVQGANEDYSRNELTARVRWNRREYIAELRAPKAAPEPRAILCDACDAGACEQCERSTERGIVCDCICNIDHAEANVEPATWEEWEQARTEYSVATSDYIGIMMSLGTTDVSPAEQRLNAARECLDALYRLALSARDAAVRERDAVLAAVDEAAGNWAAERIRALYRRALSAARNPLASASSQSGSESGAGSLTTRADSDGGTSTACPKSSGPPCRGRHHKPRRGPPRAYAQSAGSKIDPYSTARTAHH